MSYLTRSRDPQFLHLYDKCILSYKRCLVDEASLRYSDCVLNMFDVLEYFWKAIYYNQVGDYPWNHLPKLENYAAIEPFLIQIGANNTKIKGVFQAYNPNWDRNPQARMIPRYGNPQAGIGPQVLYGKQAAHRAVRNAALIASELVKINRTILLQQPELLIGILNGTCTRSRSELRMISGPYAEGCTPADWNRFFKGKQGIKTHSKPVFEINNSLSCIINPFGEAYPDKISMPGLLPSYEAIKEYIFKGGIFVSCGGLPFTYYFDVDSGLPLKETCTLLQNVPISANFATINGMPQVQLYSTTVLINTLIEKDFNLVPLMDNPPTRTGPVPCTLNQKQSDKKYWNNTTLPTTLNVFRPMDALSSKNLTPIIRTTVQGRDVYPVTFVRFGFGLLFHIGLDLRVGRQQEINFSKEAILNLLNHYSQYFN